MSGFYLIFAPVSLHLARYIGGHLARRCYLLRLNVAVCVGEDDECRVRRVLLMTLSGPSTWGAHAAAVAAAEQHAARREATRGGLDEISDRCSDPIVTFEIGRGQPPVNSASSVVDCEDHLFLICTPVVCPHWRSVWRN